MVLAELVKGAEALTVATRVDRETGGTRVNGRTQTLQIQHRNSLRSPASLHTRASREHRHGHCSSQFNR